MESIQNILDNALIEDNEKNKRKPCVSPSNLGGCIRKLMLMEKGYEPLPLEAIVLRTFKVGYLFEDFVLGVLEKKGKLLRRQEKVEYRGLSGTLDATIELNGEEVLFDCKSCKTDKFLYLDKEGIGEGYQYQLGFYHKALKNREKLSNIARVFYVEKDNLLIKEMPLICNNGLYAKVDKKIDIVNNYRADMNLPLEKEVIDWECFSVSKRFKTIKIWCQYIKHCPKIKAELDKVITDSPDYKVSGYGGKNDNNKDTE